MSKVKQTCPRRMNELGPWERDRGLDTWLPHRGAASGVLVGTKCSFCGSLHPDRFMELVREGWIVGPTDKSYKAYLQSPEGASEAKFYFQHLSTPQRHEFVDLINAGNMQIGFPGHFYQLPFFAVPETSER